MFEVEGIDRLSFLCYRCHRCGTLITKLDILAAWHLAESDKSGATHLSICPKCGGRHLSPTNPTLFEELTSPRVWKLWFYLVLVPKLKKAGGLK